MQVHKETIDKIPNALPTKNSVDIEIYGMEGIPEADIREHEKSRGNTDYTPPPAAPPKPLGTGTAAVLGAAGLIPPAAVGVNVGGGLPAAPVPFQMRLPPPPFPAGAPNPFMRPGMPAMPPVMPPGMPPLPPGMPPVPAGKFAVHKTRQLCAIECNAGPSGFNAFSQATVAAPPALNVPPKPLFPAASAMQASTTQPPPVPTNLAAPVAVQPGQVPGAASAAPPPAPVAQASAAQTSFAAGPQLAKPTSSKIVHPDEDLSLEELRARMPKYQFLWSR